MRYLYEAVLEPAEEGGYNVYVPDLPGCYTEGDTITGAADMAADAMKTYVASLLTDGETPPPAGHHDCPEGCLLVAVSFEADASYVVDGPVVSAAEASRMLGLSAGRVTHMLDAGVLEGYRSGRRTWVTVESIEARMAEAPKAGRPRKRAVSA